MNEIKSQILKKNIVTSDNNVYAENTKKPFEVKSPEDRWLSEKKLPLNPEILEKIEICYAMKMEKVRMIPKSGGIWDGEPGNSNWIPDDNIIPSDKNGTNPDGKAWKELKKEYGFDSIPFKDGEPDFSQVSKGEVQIENFSTDRSSNFSQADEALAEKRGCTPQEVAKWRKENKYTWHECSDCKTMQKVPREVHGNIPHSGGISEQKEKEAKNNQKEAE